MEKSNQMNVNVGDTAARPDKSAEVTGPSVTSGLNVVTVRYAYTYEQYGEATVALPNGTSPTEIDNILDLIDAEHGLPFKDSMPQAISFAIVDCDTINVDPDDANFVVTRDGDDWDIAKTDGWR